MINRYAESIKWIAENGEPEEMDLDKISARVSVQQLARMHNLHPVIVAAEVMRIRRAWLGDNQTEE